MCQTARQALHDGMLRMKQYCYSTQCRRTTLLQYFGENSAHARASTTDENASWYCCDNCESRSGIGAVQHEMERDVRQLLSAVHACNSSFGLNKYVGFLHADKSLPVWCKDKPGWGAGKHHTVSLAPPVSKSDSKHDHGPS